MRWRTCPAQGAVTTAGSWEHVRRTPERPVAGHGPSGDAGPMAEATPSAEPAARAKRVRRIGPEHRYGLLLLASIASLGVQGIVSPSPVQEVAVTALAGASLVLAARAAGLSGRLILYAAVLASIVIVVSAVRATAGGISEGTVTVMNAALVALGPPAIARGVVRDLRTTGEVRV